MKSFLLLSFIVCFNFLYCFSYQASGAARMILPGQKQEQFLHDSHALKTSVTYRKDELSKKERFFSKVKRTVSNLREGIKKVVKLAGKRLLIWCGISLLATITFFALGSVTVVFNYFGSVAALACTIFFVLWLLEVSKSSEGV